MVWTKRAYRIECHEYPSDLAQPVAEAGAPDVYRVLLACCKCKLCDAGGHDTPGYWLLLDNRPLLVFCSVLLGLMQPELPDVPNGPFCGVDVCSQSIETLLGCCPALFITGIQRQMRNFWSSPAVSRYHVTKSNSAPRRPHIGFLCFTPSSDAMCATSPIADWARSSSSIDTSIMETLVQQSAALTPTG